MVEATGGDGGDARPRIDVSGAVGEAGHELEDLGATDAPDDAPVVRTREDVLEDEELEDERAESIDSAQFGVSHRRPDRGG